MMKTFSEGQTYVQNEGVQNEKMVERHEKIAILGDESKKFMTGIRLISRHWQLKMLRRGVT